MAYFSRLIFALLISALFFSHSVDKVQAVETLRLHHFLNAQSTVQRGLLEPWAKRIEAASGGRLRVKMFPLMNLGGKAPQLYDQAKDGFADIVWELCLAIRAGVSR